ncbi:MAG: hypothetical protein RIS43_272 [Actinomycetota bacterium]|jgi:16S rRNA (guanine527-N7)-methyltransferase
MSEDPTVSRETVAAATARAQWPEAYPTLERYHHWLITAGVERGLVGPREIPRMWDRHINNSAVIEQAIPHGATVLDVGSGAGLPGIPLAIVRSDLKVTLLEPLARRVEFLEEVVSDLGLVGRVSVIRGRSEDLKGVTADVVTGRAVAALNKLLTWTWHLVSPGGQVLTIKGAQAAAEIEEAKSFLRKKKLSAEVLTVGTGIVDPETTLVRVTGLVAD